MKHFLNIWKKTPKELAVIKQTADEVSEFAESVINTVREPLISLDQDLRVVTVSRSFYEFFKVKPGVIANVTQLLLQHNLNVAYVALSRDEEKKVALTAIVSSCVSE